MLRFLIPLLIAVWVWMQVTGAKEDELERVAEGGYAEEQQPGAYGEDTALNHDTLQLEKVIAAMRQAYRTHDKGLFETLLTRQSLRYFRRDTRFGRYTLDIRLRESQIGEDSAVLRVYEYLEGGDVAERDYVFRRENGLWKFDLLASL